MNALVFDGHFGVHRSLEAGVDPERTVALRGRPRRQYKEFERTVPCKGKDKQRCALPAHTAGWQFVLDPDSLLCLGAKEHIQNECMPDTVDIVCAVMRLPNVHPDLLIHDAACLFERHVQTHHEEYFADVKYFCIDYWHRCNHKCSKRTLTRRESNRMKGVPSAYAESFNSWIRPFNFFLNNLRPSSHRFWVDEIIRFFNQNRHALMSGFHGKARSNALMRRKGN